MTFANCIENHLKLIYALPRVCASEIHKRSFAASAKAQRSFHCWGSVDSSIVYYFIDKISQTTEIKLPQYIGDKRSNSAVGIRRFAQLFSFFFAHILYRLCALFII